MIVVDTNVVSELMRQAPESQVLEWFECQITSHLFVTTITIAEISYGLHALPQGKRRMQLEKAFSLAISESFMNRILSFDAPAAYIYGKIMSTRKARGQPMSIADGQIAAITLACEAMLATRNTADFKHCGVECINPFY